MNSVPAPPSTASAAASIWSGVGEVNTWPGQAASSMPRPTNPPCSGSWPEPPPEISATLPDFSVLRRMNLWPPPSVTMSACAAAKPSKLFGSMSSMALINFFMLSSHSRAGGLSRRDDDRWLAALGGDAGYPLDEVVDRAVERRALLGIAQIGHRRRDMPRTLHLSVYRSLARVREAIGAKEHVALLLAEMADGE